MQRWRQNTYRQTNSKRINIRGKLAVRPTQWRRKVHRCEWKCVRDLFCSLAHSRQGITLILRYDGEWAIGKKKGNGKMTWVSGDVYDGEWLADRYHGVGACLLSMEKTPLALNADVVGTYHHQTGQGDDDKDGFSYSGAARLLLPVTCATHPYTVFTCSLYPGDWKNGVREGSGKLKTANYRYDGEWHNNIPYETAHSHRTQTLYPGRLTTPSVKAKALKPT